MRIRSAWLALAGVLIGCTSQGIAKGKQKETISPAILAARSVAVIIDPDSGDLATDPFANRTARKDVETALLNWGRYEVRTVGQPADLIIVVRKGKEGVVNGTIHDPRQNDRPGAINPLDDGIQVGAQRGQPIGASSAGEPTRGTAPMVQAEAGPSEDSFLVYNGMGERPLNSSPLWRYMAADGLRAHKVPAAEEFRKAVIEAEKAAAQKKP